MKNVKLLFVAFTLLALQATAAIASPVKPNQQLRAEIIQIIGTDCPYNLNQKECTAEVLFTINSKGELIVLTVNSENENAESFIKNKLNYKKVTLVPTKEGELFLLPIRIVQGS
jgi:hypothetical protein